MNALTPILHFARTRKDALALIEGSQLVTYGELADLMRRTACHLRSLGLRQGDLIGLCLKDSLHHVITLLGAAYMGGVVVPLDWRARATENAHLIEALQLKYVIAEAGARIPDKCQTILLNAEWHEALASASADIEPVGSSHDPFVISATSGSTGNPRFTVMSHQQYRYAIAGMFELMDLMGHHRFLSTLPLYYSGGRNSCLTHLLRGDCVVLYSNLFTPREYLDLVKRYDITTGTVVPSVLRQFLAASWTGPMLPKLSKLFCTGAPLHPEEKLEALHKITPNLHERYGTAETLGVSVLRPTGFAGKSASVGLPHSLIEVEIVDQNEQKLPIEAIGKLRLRGPGLGSPLILQGQENSFHHGWFYPGEVAHLDADGYIFLSGRISDVIIRSGAKIFPAEVERTLLEHSAIIEAAVLGHIGGDNEERVIAFVVSQQPVPVGELLAHCRARLTPHKVPQAIYFLDYLPKNTAGKTAKHELAKQLESLDS